MSRARPGREQEKDLGAAVTPDRVPLVRFEAGQRARWGIDLLGSGAERDGALDHHDPGVLLHLMVAQLLAGIEANEDRPGFVVALEDDGRAAPSRRLDLGQLPRLHGRGV